MKNKNLLQSIGFTIAEFKKSFFMNYFFLLILFGLGYVFFIILLGLYKLVNSYNNALFLVSIAIFFFIIFISTLFVIMNKIKKIALLKVINYELKSKNKKLLLFIENFLDKEFKASSSQIIKRLIRFFIVIIFSLFILFLVFGAILIVTNLILKTIVILAFLLLFGSFILFITRYIYFVNSVKELILSYPVFVKEFNLILSTLIISLIPVSLLLLLYIVLPSSSIINYIFLFILLFLVNLVFYFNFFVFSFIFLDDKK